MFAIALFLGYEIISQYFPANFKQEWGVNWCYSQVELSSFKFNKEKKLNWVSCFYL